MFKVSSLNKYKVKTLDMTNPTGVFLLGKGLGVFPIPGGGGLGFLFVCRSTSATKGTISKRVSYVTGWVDMLGLLVLF